METAELRPARSNARSLLSLPAISSEVPANLERGNSRSQLLARLVLAGEAERLKLPGGEFKHVNDVLAHQWMQYADSVSPELGKLLPAHPEVVVTDDALLVTMVAQANLPTFFLKDMVESLEKVSAGLGWFVVEVMTSACGSGMAFYDLRVVTYHMESRFYDLDEFTDQCFARMLLCEEGSRDYDDEEPVSDEAVNQLREQYPFWPSQLLEAAGGHARLLGHRSTSSDMKAQPHVPQMKPAMVQKWIKANHEHPQLECVKAALALHKQLSKKDATAFVFDSSYDELEAIGAMCFVAWEHPEMVYEAAGHAEEYAYNGNGAVEAVGRKVIPLENAATDGDLSQLVTEFKAYINAWHLFEKLMSHFPKEE